MNKFIEYIFICEKYIYEKYNQEEFIYEEYIYIVFFSRFLKVVKKKIFIFF